MEGEPCERIPHSPLPIAVITLMGDHGMMLQKIIQEGLNGSSKVEKIDGKLETRSSDILQRLVSAGFRPGVIEVWVLKLGQLAEDTQVWIF